MKIISIEMSAFGPFKNKEVIDFTNYDADKIFLISGKTGSGKTTIFDAISYALFGKMTGEFRNESSIRSQYASRDEETYVKLVFEKDSRRYEVSRKPSYFVEGRKSKINGDATLADITSSVKVLGTKSSVINSMIEDIIGFKYAQFKQIVVLPQGEFIKILNSKSNEKEVLLSSILDTSKYSLLSEKIREDYSELEVKIGNVEQQLQHILQEYKVDNEEELKNLKDKKEEEVNLFSKVVKEDEEQIKLLQDKIKKHTDNNKNLDILRDLEGKKKALLEENKDIDDKKDLLKRLKILNSINGYRENLFVSEKELEEQKEKNKILEEELNKLKIEYDKLDEYNLLLKSLKEELDNLKEYAASLKNLEETENIIEENKKEIKSLEECILKENKNKEIAVDAKKQLDNQKERLIKEIEEKNKFVNDYDVNDYSRLKEINDGYEKIKNLMEKVKHANESLDIDNREKENLQSREKVWKNIQKNNVLQGYISELEEGKECPLCGSKNHPNILKKIEDFVSETQLEELQDDIKRKDERITSMLTQKKLWEEEIEKYDVDLSKENIIRKQFEDASNNQKKFFEYREKLKNLNVNLSDLDNDIKERESEIKKISEELVSRGTSLALLKKNNVDLSAKLNKELNGKTLSDLRNSNDSKIRELEKKEEKINDTVNDITIKYQDCNNKLNDGCEKKKTLENSIASNKIKIEEFLNNSIISDKDLDEYMPKLNELETIENSISNYELSLAKVTADIETYTSLITSNDYVDCNELEEKLNKLKDKYSEENSKFIEMTTSIGIIKKDYQRYIELANSIASSLERYKMIAKLNKLCNGTLSGGKKISLQKFVLMKLLDEILVYANKYLLNFSSSRYSLVREESDALSEKGLDLSVFDEHTGYCRPVSSLSGGESFISALALALGMSECIMNMYGGIKMDNIFVDEGFGSLDSESLNNAIETLMQLAANGRMIGIISHIDAIKQMIPHTIEVEKTKNGSTIHCEY